MSQLVYVLAILIVVSCTISVAEAQTVGGNLCGDALDWSGQDRWGPACQTTKPLAAYASIIADNRGEGATLLWRLFSYPGFPCQRARCEAVAISTLEWWDPNAKWFETGPYIGAGTYNFQLDFEPQRLVVRCDC